MDNVAKKGFFISFSISLLFSFFRFSQSPSVPRASLDQNILSTEASQGFFFFLSLVQPKQFEPCSLVDEAVWSIYTFIQFEKEAESATVKLSIYYTIDEEVQD